MESVASHINEMQKIYEEFGNVFDDLMRGHSSRESTTSDKRKLELNVGDMQVIIEVGDSSVVEPAPQDASIERLSVQIPLSPPAGPSFHRCALTCLETENNLAASPLRHTISQCASMETDSRSQHFSF